MTKIREEDNFDDLNFDDLGDWEEFGSFDDGEPAVGSRSVFKRLIGGFKDGVKSSFIDPKNHKQVVKEALPKGYSRIYDSAEFAVESTSDLLREAQRGYGQNRDQLKKAMREILPSFGENAQSSRIGKNIKNWSEDIRSPQQSQDVDPEAAFLATELSDTFGAPNDAAVGGRSSSEDKEQKVKQVSETAQRKLMEHASRTSQILSDRVGMAQANEMIHHLSGSHLELKKLTAYQDQVTSQYQRKSLEIKYRHYFVARKSLDVLMQGLDLSKTAYEKLIVNTSLPEAVKIQSSEHAQMILREKFLGSAIQPAQAKLGQIGARVLQKGKMKIQEFFKDLGAGLANINDATSAVLGPDSGIDPWEMGGDIVGQQVGGRMMKGMAKKAAGFFGQNKKLARLGLAGSAAIENGGRIFQSLLRNDTGIGAFEWLKGTGFLDEFAYRRDETVRKDASSLLDEQALWDQKSRKALTEVIPGLLEKINYNTAVSNAILRGDTSMPSMERYNYASGLFESETDIRNRIKKDVFGDASNKDTAQALRNFVGEFEQKRKLSKEAKAALMNTALQEALGGGIMNMEAYSRGEKRWSTDDKLNDEIQKAFMETFYSDYQAGVDDNADGSLTGDLNRTFRRGETIAQRTKAMAALQAIADHQGVLDKSTMLKHMNVAGGNTLLDLGVVKQEGNTLVINRDKIDANIIRQALNLDVGYLTSSVFDLEETENSLGHSVNSHVKKLITDLDKRYLREVDPNDVLRIRTAYSIIKDHVFAGSNRRLLDVTDLETSEKKKLLDAFAKKLYEWMGGAEFNQMGEAGQEYFKQRLDLIKTAMNAANITAPLRDFFHDPLQIDENAWGKSKKKVLDSLREAGLDEAVLSQLESAIKDVKDSSGRTVDMKIAELTGTKTYSEAARFLNRMTDKGLNWVTKSLKDPNTPPDPVLEPGSMFTKLSKTADHLSKHSAVGRWMYSQLLKMDSTVNNSYENIKNNQALKSEIDQYGSNANGEINWYEGSKRNPFYSLVESGNPYGEGYGVRSRGRGKTEPEEERTEEQTNIIQSAADVVVDIFRNFADRMDRFNGTGSTAPRMSWSNQGPLFNPAKASQPSNMGTITGINADIEIHHTGGIVGKGRRWGGAGELFGNAQRYHTGGVVEGELQIEHDGSRLGLMNATLPNGQQITVFDHRLAKKGFDATSKDYESAIKRGRDRIYSKYSRFFKSSSARSRSALKPDEVPAVLQRGEEVLTANDPRHRDNIGNLFDSAKGFTFNSISRLSGGVLSPDMLRRVFDSLPLSSEPGSETKSNAELLAGEANPSPIQPVESVVKQDTSSKAELELGAGEQILSGILENTSITNELLQELLLKEFGGGGSGAGFFKRQMNKIKNGWNKGKTKIGKLVTNVRSRISSLFGGDGPGLFSKAKGWVKDKLTGLPERLSGAKDWIKGKGQAAWTKAGDAFDWAKDKGSIGFDWLKTKGAGAIESAQELGQRLKAKIPTLDEIKKFGGVMVDKTWVPAKQFVAEKYQASAEWWKANYPKFSMDFSEFWTGFKEKFKNWKPVSWAGDKLKGVSSFAGKAWDTAKGFGDNLLNGPRKLKNWLGGKVRSGLNMLKGFMSGGLWAAMKYRDAESIVDEVSGLRQVYLGIVDLQSIIMDRLPKPRSKWNDKDGDGKRDASARFIGRANEPEVDKDGNILPGQEKKTEGLLGSIFGTSMMGLAIKALIGGIVGETMSNLFGFDLGLIGNTLAGMATVGGGIWAAKKAAGWATKKATGWVAGKAAGALSKRRGAAGDVAEALAGQNSGCCCCDDGMDALGDSSVDERRKKRGKRGKKGRSRGGRNQQRNTRVTRGGARAPTGAAGAAGAAGSQAAQAAGRGAGAAGAAGSQAAQAAGRAAGARALLGGAGNVAGRLAVPLAVGMSGYQLYQTITDEEMSTEDKIKGGSEIVGGLGGGLAGAAAGAAIGSIVPGVGTLIGGAVGGLGGYLLGGAAGSAVGSAINAVRENPLMDLAKDTGGMLLAGMPVFGAMKAAMSLWNVFDADESPLTTFRFAQYGFDIKNEKYGKALLGLEADLLKEVKAVEGKTPTIHPKRPVEEYFEMFAVDPTNEAEKMEWLQWFHYRFKPVFLSHVNEWYRILKNTKLHDGDDKIGKTAAPEYLKNVHYKNPERAPYRLVNNPFGDEKGKLLDAKDVTKAYETAVKAAKNLPDRPVTDPEKKALGMTDQKNRALEAKENLEVKKAEEAAKEESSGGWFNSLKSTAGSLWKSAGDFASSAWDSAKGLGASIAGTAGAMWDSASELASDVGDGISNVVAKMTGSQKEWQMRVYKAFKNAGFSEQQARILTAEIGRENSYNPEYLFGGHADPHKGTNLGMLSWQGDRKPRLIGFLRQAGVLDRSGNIIPGQASLDAQARFIMWELRNTHSKVGSKFLANPNISYSEGSFMIGKSYILWRITDPKYAGPGKRNRDGFYNMLLAQLGAKDGDGATSTAAAAPTKAPAQAAAPAPAPPPLLARPGTAAVGTQAQGAIQGQAAGMVGNAQKKVNSPPTGVALLSYGQGQKTTTGGAADWDADKMVQTLIRNAGSKSKGQCAKYVRMAMQAGDLKKKFITGLASAYMYVAALPKMGWSKIGSVQSVKPVKGDICVFPRYGQPGSDGYKHGHICMYTGKQWISDFYQKTAFPNSKNQSLEGYIFRAGAIADTGKEYGSSTAAGELDENGNPKLMTPNPDAPEGIRSGTTSTSYGFTYKGTGTSKSTYSEKDHLSKLQGGGTAAVGAAKAVSYTDAEKKSLSASEIKNADKARLGMGMSNVGATELEKIAGFGLAGATNAASLRDVSVLSTKDLASETKADLTAVKEAENIATAKDAKRAEIERMEKANALAKTNRVVRDSNDAQAEMVNIMRESLTVTKQIHLTLKEMSQSLQTMAKNSGTSLRGEESGKPKGNTPRKPTPPETVPVSMRI